MMRKNLTQEFNSIFTDTEKNISSIKRQLGDQGRHPIAPRSPVNVNSASSTLGQTTYNNLNSQSKSPLNNYASPNKSQTTLITSMFNRLEEQSKTIALLENMIHAQNDEIRKIKDAQNETKRSPDGTDGIDFQRRLENVEQELRREIESIRNSIKSSPSNGYRTYDNNYERTYLSEDIKSQRRYVESETDALRHEVDNLKSRIGKIEYEVNTSLRDAADVTRKYGHIESDIANIITNQRNLRSTTEGGERQLQTIKNELEEISIMIRRLRTEDKHEVNNNNAKSSYRKRDYNHHGHSSKSVESSPTMSLPSPISDEVSFNSFEFSDVEVISSISKELNNGTRHISLPNNNDDDDDDDDDYINNVGDDILQFDSDLDEGPTAKQLLDKSKRNDKKHISFLSDDNADDDDDDDIPGFDSDIEQSPRSVKFNVNEFVARDARHTSLLDDDDDDDDDILGLNSANGDDELFLEKGSSITSLDKLKLSDFEDDENGSLGRLSDNSL